MKQALTAAVMTSIEAFLHVPGTQLQTIEATLRQLMTDLKNSNITPPAELDGLIEEAAIASAEDMAYMNGVAYGDGPYFQPYDDSEPPFDVVDWMNDNWSTNGVIHPNEEMKQELDELPF